VHEAHLQKAIHTRVFLGTFFQHILIYKLTFFSGPILSYKCKNDLIILSDALGLRTVGTVLELTNQVKGYLSLHLKI